MIKSHPAIPYISAPPIATFPANDDEEEMAGVKFSAISGEVALTAATLKTVLQLLAPANQRVLIDTLEISFDGISPTNEPVLVQIMRQTTAGTMAGSVTPAKLDSTNDETLQVTASYGATVEPTASTVLHQFHVHPQAGLIFQFPDNRRIVIPGGTRLAVVCTAPNNVNCNATVTGEE